MGSGDGRYTGQALNNTNPLRRDTVLIPAYSYLVMRFVTDNRESLRFFVLQSLLSSLFLPHFKFHRPSLSPLPFLPVCFFSLRSPSFAHTFFSILDKIFLTRSNL